MKLRFHAQSYIQSVAKTLMFSMLFFYNDRKGQLIITKSRLYLKALCLVVQKP